MIWNLVCFLVGTVVGWFTAVRMMPYESVHGTRPVALMMRWENHHFILLNALGTVWLVYALQEQR